MKKHTRNIFVFIIVPIILLIVGLTYEYKESIEDQTSSFDSDKNYVSQLIETTDLVTTSEKEEITTIRTTQVSISQTLETTKPVSVSEQKDLEIVTNEPETTTLEEEKNYKVSPDLLQEMDEIYWDYDFTIGWALYDISGSFPKEVASYNTEDSFQSNCTIKAAMLLYLCQEMDCGNISEDTYINVNKEDLHYDDFPLESGSYSVDYLAYKMINVSNNSCYEVFLRYFTMEEFNSFLNSIGSNTVIYSYNYMGNCYIQDRATEWFAIYQYCHSNKDHSEYAWNLLTDAKFSPIRDGIERTVAHKSGWHYKEDKDVYGSAADCAIVSTKNGGCYLLIIFTQNNNVGKYSERLISRIAICADKIWDEYYFDISPGYAEF